MAVVNAIPIGLEHHEPEHHAPAHYDFSYSVHDEHTGDIKSQHESRNGDAVHGSYSLIDSDGYKRIVEYTADHHNGFNAVVHREPTHIKIPVPVHKVVAAPVYHHVAPVHHVAPIHHAPVVHHIAAPIVHHVAPAVHIAPAHHHVVAESHSGVSHVSVSGLGASYHY